MWEQVRAQWRFIAVGIALVALAVGALAAGVAVLAQGNDKVQAAPTMRPPTVEATAAAGESSGGATQGEGPATPPPPQGATYHTVQTGETLNSIAADFGVSAAAIASANGLANPNLIRVGQRLMIPAR